MLIANPERLGLETVAAALEPPPPVDYLAWARPTSALTKGNFPARIVANSFRFGMLSCRRWGPTIPAATSQ